jgi:mRNA-degrading endonuclease toxin of MazEF toxin-antitoxin module
VSPSRAPQLGSIVWAELQDANGIRKVRPAVVVTATADICAGKPLRLVAITTRLPNPIPDDHVLLPWDRQGKARSGLRRRCAAVASWQAEIELVDVQQVVGILPPPVIGALLTKITAILAPPPALPSAGAGGPSSSPPVTPTPHAADHDDGDP